LYPDAGNDISSITVWVIQATKHMLALKDSASQDYYFSFPRRQDFATTGMEQSHFETYSMSGGQENPFLS
jgi:hypothetical protein